MSNILISKLHNQFVFRKPLYSCKPLLIAASVFFNITGICAQTCFTISSRTNGNGQSNTCGANCSGAAKTGHIEINFGASCPSPIPTLQLVAVSPGALPSPFCFDAGNCLSPGVVRYCFRGNNLPGSGSMNLRITSGATVYTCNYLVTGGSGSVVLPVTISAFDVVKTNGKQCLTWKVEDESDIQFYTVQYSSNGVDYNDIEKVTATNNNQPHNYSYCDELEKTTGLYRLKINEQSGRMNYSYTVRITQKQITAFALYPVPATDVIYIESPLDLKNTVYTILNVNGQKQKTGKLSIARSADIHDLPRGIYFMRIQAGGQTHTVQFEKK